MSRLAKYERRRVEIEQQFIADDSIGAARRYRAALRYIDRAEKRCIQRQEARREANRLGLVVAKIIARFARAILGIKPEDAPMDSIERRQRNRAFRRQMRQSLKIIDTLEAA